MSQDINDFVTLPCDLLAFGEPTHLEQGFGRLRNQLFAQLADRGFRSIALETDRVAALAVNDYVQGGAGTLDAAMSEGFSHGFGEFDANRRLVAWMREYNESRPAEQRLVFHGFDAAMEMMSAPSPRSYLEFARDYLGIDLDLAGLVGDDERWSRTEAILDPAMSVGATAEAEKLRSIADDMLTTFYVRAPELIAATSRAEWFRAKTHLTSGLGLLRYHRQSAKHLEQSARVAGLSAIRDALMAQNLLEIRDIEARRGATLVFAHNLHLKRGPSYMRLGDMDINWSGAGAILASLLGAQYTFVAGSLGRSAAIGLGEPEQDTYEGALQSRITTWELTKAASVAAARTRTDTTPEQGYFPLDGAILGAADAILHIADGAIPE
ncbi:erythromycin esterase family protein [Saccharopolyspora elongata]|uniref:Erythromycin esterase family protein n=1 Tax=Saccharopolyspora elongata TaxID=2530387 RepID=A0A4R4XVK8_9PSEU|nr:erythromycin esterase family protein [Saccharopolyspora elongata]TDD34632.1 erythromycin esterase family protein [Saccharopolyspora elongata]